MKNPKYLRWILAVEAGGILTALVTWEGTRAYMLQADKPQLTPPAILFPVVWTVLYGLMGISAARIAAKPSGTDRSWGLNLFVSQLIVNYFWSLLFFNAQAYGLALLWLVILWILIVAMILHFRILDREAAKLQIPYLLWVSFAGYLNYAVWQANL